MRCFVPPSTVQPSLAFKMKYQPGPLSPRRSCREVIRSELNPNRPHYALCQTYSEDVPKYVTPCCRCYHHHVRNNTFKDMDDITQAAVNDAQATTDFLNDCGVALGEHTDSMKNSWGDKEFVSWYVYYCPVCKHVEQFTR